MLPKDIPLPEEERILSCAPWWIHPEGKKAPWRDHWIQAIYYLPKELHVQNQEKINVTGFHDEYSLWFNVNGNR